MPIIILHGEHLTRSRTQLIELINKFRHEGRDVTRLTASELNLPVIEKVLGETSLFGTPSLVVIEELHSLVKSNRKTELIDALSAATQASAPPDLILWEKRSLTKPMLKKFPSAQVQEFKVSNSVFAWLDSLSGQPSTKSAQLKAFHQALAAEDIFFCFTMLIRQIRLLIQAKDGGLLTGPPFMISKLQAQSQRFTLSQLLKAHRRLLELDLAHKTSNNRLPLDEDLDLLLLHL